ncbi:related to PHM7 - similarity to A.thaliana hyp1 protein [Cephalotrichum gorgonifer]|uniref:Related to PHM7 - similarity to A.thaliana hyp1 protein n=1 Tax=Cephalotrichum gorgonifer TaxID=2041049 RepID=A0AAE8SRX6_9PEZI|nr:related to PHM7 - similarity to A.thaliana hyp1 protein [Cephalotrichum gorgonifer]
MSSTEGTTSLASTATSLVSSVVSSVLSSATASSTPSSTSSTRPPESTPTELPEGSAGSAQGFQGISLKAFLGALVVALIVFAVQIAIFLLLRNKLSRIFKPKTYLVPDRERTDAPPTSPLAMLRALMRFSDREVIDKCGLDAFFFLRYLKTLLVIFVPIAVVVIPILVPLNYVDGRGQEVVADRNATAAAEDVSGLDTLAWGNIKAENTSRYWAHLVLALLVIGWVCLVFFLELRVYVKVRQDYLTSAEHRLRASATTVLVNSIPSKWLSEEALKGLFDVFPGGIRNIWLNRDLNVLLDKIHERTKVHQRLEDAETELIKEAKRRQLKQRKREEKLQRRERREKGPSKEERAQRDKDEDEKAKRMAGSGQGFSSGEHDDVPHEIADVLGEDHDPSHHRHPDSKGGPLGLGGLTKIGQGILGGVGKAGKGFKAFGQDVDDTIETTNGFVALEPANSTKGPTQQSSGQYRTDNRPETSDSYGHHSRAPSTATQDTAPMKRETEGEPAPNFGNTVRKATNLDDMYLKDEVSFWQFWKAPAGGYASPIPQGAEEGDEFPFPNKDLSTWQRLKMALPFLHADVQGGPVTYPSYWNESADKGEEAASSEQRRPEAWEKWLKRKDRPTHRVAKVSWIPDFLAVLPLIGRKVDTIDWCRKELARLNMEIEEDQKHPERYPLMNSAFIQFNHQVSAHMACQSLVHHVPKQMAPREVEISPRDVIWDNMAISWWQAWARGAIVTAIVAGMIAVWSIPVAFTASLGQLDSLVARFHWLEFLDRNAAVKQIAQVVVGVLPALLLSLLLFLVPVILGILAEFKGAKTGSQKTEFVQMYFFVFLFIQVFLIVSITSFFVASVDTLFANLRQLSDVNAILNLLADNLPKAANYFFSYMILQALSTSSGTLLQVGALFTWYIVARILDSTARNKWSRNTKLSDIKWGSFFPVYTNFACIGLIYSVVAPLISIFAVITFGLLWVAQRYSMLYVTRFEHDTGGVLYPRAINQTFTGLYVMELALAGLFFIVRDKDGNNACTSQGIIMLVSLGLTIIYQVLLNRSFGPLFRYLPITFEDEACIRDEVFARAQAQRLGLDESYSDEPGNDGSEMARFSTNDEDVELKNMSSSRDRADNKAAGSRFAPLNAVRKVGTWAQRDGSKAIRTMTFQNKDKRRSRGAAEYRRLIREKDIESQRAIGEALFGGYHDEIEDLTPDERDALVRYAFQHEALRARRPTVWIPRDDLGVSDDEIRRTRELSEFVWVSNEGTALDSKVRVVYGRAPPDFSEVDLINL